MIDQNIGRLRLKVYGGIDELPSERYNKFNIYCLLRAGIGNDAESIATHIQDLATTIGKNDTERAMVQLNNYYHALNMILNHEDTQSMAFACLVHSINGVEITDISEEGLRWIVSRIARAEKRVQAAQLFDLLKKKIEDEIEEYFPERVNESRISMYYNYLNKYNRLKYKKLLGEDVEKEITKVEEEFYLRSKPVSYGGTGGLLLKLEKDYETNCLLLQQNGAHNPEKTPILKFYQLIELIHKQKDNGKHKERK